MPEVLDVVVPILQRIQGDISDIKATLAEHSQKLDEHSRKLDQHSERFEEIERYLAYNSGLS